MLDEMSLITTSSSELSTPLQQYLREIGEVELLTAEEEIELAKLIHKGLKAEKQLKQAVKIKRDKTFIIRLKKQIRSGDEARKKMISANLRLVVKIAQEYAHYGVPLLDLISEGNLGLIKAIERFDPKKGAKLSTYGAWWIKQAVRRALSDQGSSGSPGLFRVPARRSGAGRYPRRAPVVPPGDGGRRLQGPMDSRPRSRHGCGPRLVCRIQTGSLAPHHSPEGLLQLTKGHSCVDRSSPEGTSVATHRRWPRKSRVSLARP